ncbi:hypothetical protein [Streptomyces sp. CBMA152]|uniref:hypothetical protein n=1 Tax=Streptomyces sp. CBMA152 TaxID=1896312 RepID=UPI001660A96B|nr:hypothetical protein [Streptomyces sp. CBMA152]
MARSPRSGPATAQALHRALAALGAAPTADPKQRPHGPQPEDTPLLLGVLLAKAELDAAVRADPSAYPPDGLTALITGYNALIGTGSDIRLRLMSLRLIRTAIEITTHDDATDSISEAAESATLAAANLVNALRYNRSPPDEDEALSAALDAAARFSRDLAVSVKRARHEFGKPRTQTAAQNDQDRPTGRRSATTSRHPRKPQ